MKFIKLLLSFATTKALKIWNSWPQNPEKDATFGNRTAGDTFLCYPRGEPSWRFLELRNGIAAAEKIRILKASGELKASAFKSLASKYDVKSANNGKCDYSKLRNETLEFVNK